MLAPIFRSDGQARLLAALVLMGDELTINDLAARTNLAYATAHREVTRLIDAGILEARNVGRARLIRVHDDSPIVPPLREILAIAVGPAPILRRELHGIAGVEAAFLYGSMAARLRGSEGPSPRDVDVMVVGVPAAHAVYDACARAEHELRRPVNPTIMSRKELADSSGFLESIRGNPVVPIVGDVPWV